MWAAGESPVLSLDSGPSLVISGSWVWSPLWASPHLSLALDGVGGLVHLAPVQGGGIVEPTDRLQDDVLGGVLQRQSPVLGQ